MSWSVLFREFPLEQLDKTAAAVAGAYGITDYDARSKIRRGWGFLDRNLPAEAARGVVPVLAQSGVAALAVENAQLREPAEPLVILGGTATADGFAPQFQSPQEPARVIRWADVAIVAAGGFAEDVVRRDTTGGKDKSTGTMLMGLGIFMVTGIPMGIFGGGKKAEAKPVKSKRLITFGCLITNRGEHLAFSPDHFDFSMLGGRKQLNAAANFRLLLDDCRRLTPARLNWGARFLLDNKSLTLANYQRLSDFENELLWMSNCDRAA